MSPATATRPAAKHAAREQQQRWNLGMVGASAAPKYTSGLTEPCYTERCGEPLGPDELGDDGWTLALVCGSAEPPRWWCCLRCAGRGIALAQLRRDPMAAPAMARPADRCPDGCGGDFRADSPNRAGWVLTCHFHPGGRTTTWWCGGACAQGGLTAQAAGHP